MIENLRPWSITYVRVHPVESRVTVEHTGLSRDAMMTAAIQWAKAWGEQTLPGWELESVLRPESCQ